MYKLLYLSLGMAELKLARHIAICCEKLNAYTLSVLYSAACILSLLILVSLLLQYNATLLYCYVYSHNLVLINA